MRQKFLVSTFVICYTSILGLTFKIGDRLKEKIGVMRQVQIAFIILTAIFLRITSKYEDKRLRIGFIIWKLLITLFSTALFIYGVIMIEKNRMFIFFYVSLYVISILCDIFYIYYACKDYCNFGKGLGSR